MMNLRTTAFLLFAVLSVNLMTCGANSQTILRVNAEFTRPADTTAYVSGDAVNNSTSAPVAMQFKANATGKGFTSGVGKVIAAQIQKSTQTATNATFRLHLLNSNITPPNDNAAINMLFADRATYLGFIDFTTMIDVGDYAANPPSLMIPAVVPFVLDPAQNTILYGMLEARAGYAPGSAEVFSVTLTIEQR